MRTTAADYLRELINYGGELKSRGYVYQDLIEIAATRGFSQKEARVLADRWMQGHDLREKIETRAKGKV